MFETTEALSRNAISPVSNTARNNVTAITSCNAIGSPEVITAASIALITSNRFLQLNFLINAASKQIVDYLLITAHNPCQNIGLQHVLTISLYVLSILIKNPFKLSSTTESHL